MRILFCGHNKWACLTLKALLEAGHDVLGVVTETDAFDQREADVYERFAKFGAYESLEVAAERAALPVYQPEDINDADFIATIDALSPELIVCVSYHAILKKGLIERHPQRIVNAHLAPLPYYRGRAPLNWAIINGEDHTAVTVHFVDEGIDTGPIIAQKQISILNSDRAIDVLLRALPAFPETVLSAIRKIEKGNVDAILQSPFEGSYFPKRTPDDGLIDWGRETSQDIYNKIRALTDPYPGAFSYLKNNKVIFLRSQLPNIPRRISPVGGLVFGKGEGGCVHITTDDAYLLVEEVRIGETSSPAAEYLKAGARLLPFPIEGEKLRASKR